MWARLHLICAWLEPRRWGLRRESRPGSGAVDGEGGEGLRGTRARMSKKPEPGFRGTDSVIETLWVAGAWSVVRPSPNRAWEELDPGMLARRPRPVGPRYRGWVFSSWPHWERAQHGSLLPPWTGPTPRTATGSVLTPASPPTRHRRRAVTNTPAAGRIRATTGLNLGSAVSYPFNLSLANPPPASPAGLSRPGSRFALQIVGPMLPIARVPQAGPRARLRGGRAAPGSGALRPPAYPALIGWSAKPAL